jgi:hypothetical protein
MNDDWVTIYIAMGPLAASMIVDFLKAHGISALFRQESVGSTYGLTVGPLGECQILVPIQQEDAAKSLLDAMERGDFELPEDNLDSPTED